VWRPPKNAPTWGHISFAKVVASNSGRKQPGHESKADESKQKDGREEAKVPESRSNAASRAPPRAAREEVKEGKEEKEHDREEPDDDADCADGCNLPHCLTCDSHFLVPAVFDCCDHGVSYCVPCAHQWFKASPYPSSSVEFVNGDPTVIVVEPYPCPECRKSVSSVNDVPLAPRQALSPIEVAAAKSDDALLLEAQQLVMLARVGAAPEEAEAVQIEDALIDFKYQDLVQARKDARDKIAASAGEDVAGSPYAAAVAASNIEAQAEVEQAGQLERALADSAQSGRDELALARHLEAELQRVLVASGEVAVPPLHAPIIHANVAAESALFERAVAESIAEAAQAELHRQQEEDELVRIMEECNAEPNFSV
jgi:hypothetical protein